MENIARPFDCRPTDFLSVNFVKIVFESFSLSFISLGRVFTVFDFVVEMVSLKTRRAGSVHSIASTFANLAPNRAPLQSQFSFVQTVDLAKSLAFISWLFSLPQLFASRLFAERTKIQFDERFETNQGTWFCFSVRVCCADIRVCSFLGSVRVFCVTERL